MTSGDAVTAPDHLYDAYVFDQDGTIYLGEDLLPGAKRLVEELRARDRAVRFVSNNPTKDPEMYAEKLGRLGLPTPVEEIVNTVVTMTEWILDHHPDAVVYPIAEEPLIRAFEQAGIRMSEDPAEIDIVVASYDRTFTYAKLQIAFDALWFHKRARLVATNPDRFCPMPGGRGEPDCAAIVAAIEACTGVECEANAGKPYPTMVRAAIKGLGVEPENCMMVGDRLQTDIQMGIAAGMASALVLTGESQQEDVDRLSDDERPTVVLDRIDRLVPADLWSELGWTDDDDV